MYLMIFDPMYLTAFWADSQDKNMKTKVKLSARNWGKKWTISDVLSFGFRVDDMEVFLSPTCDPMHDGS